MRFAYFGGEPLGKPMLEKLLEADLKPALVVCNPDRPSGRGQKLTPPPLKELALKNDLPVFQPENLATAEKTGKLANDSWDLFVVVAYNRILPSWLIELPKHKTINLHPSLLPKLRGPNPIREAILHDQPEAVGVTVMVLDEEMDHGPIIAAEPVSLGEEDWPPAGPALDKLLAEAGGRLLAEVIPKWTAGGLEPKEQDHEAATYTKKFTKDMGELKIDPFLLPSGQPARIVFFKIQALAEWPGTYFFYKDKRIKIVGAQLDRSGALEITRVIPEGKTEMNFKDWLRTHSK